jgi:hypothetical protein
MKNTRDGVMPSQFNTFPKSEIFPHQNFAFLGGKEKPIF